MAQAVNDQNNTTTTATTTTNDDQKVDAVPKKKKFGFASVKSAVTSSVSAAANKIGNTVDAADDRLSMTGQLKAARISLEKFLDPKLQIEQQIPVKLLAGAKGIVFLSSIKGGFGIGGSIGTGIVISRLDYGEGWSQPCSIGLLGGQWGFNIGVQKTDFIIVLRDQQALKVFTGKGQIKFGVDASIAAGPKGRDAAIALNVNDNGYTSTVSYSQSKGLYVGIALEGQGISVRKDCNAKYYGKPVTPKQILTGDVNEIPNDDHDQIGDILDEFTKDKGD